MDNKSKQFSFEQEFGAEYEALARQIIPGYETIFSMAFAYLKQQLPNDAKLLIVGCGSGMEILTFARHQPSWQMTGVDPAVQMIAITQQKIKRFQLKSPIKLLHGTVDQLAPEQLYDAATCIFVLHILPDEEKLALLQDIAVRLKPNGVLVLVDTVLPTHELYNLDVWATHTQAMKIDQQKINDIVSHSEEERFIATEEQLLALAKQAGFRDPCRFYTALCYSGWILRR